MLARLLAMLLLAAPAAARTLEVGPGAAFPDLAAAARAAQDGDTIHLAAGTYYECAVLPQAGLVIQGDGPGTVLTDRVCQDKAALVLQGAGDTVRDLVLARARTSDGNGAGIRLEAQGLRVERVRFDNDQVGLLAGQAGDGTIWLSDCVFTGGGVGGETPHAAVVAGAVALLHVERSTVGAAEGGQVASDALRTELVDNRFETGAEPASAFAIRTGGALDMRGNTLALGPNPALRDAAVLALGPAQLRANRLENRTGRPVRLLLDWGGDAVLDGNTLQPGDQAVSTDGAWRHAVGDAARGLAGQSRAAASVAKRAVLSVFGR